MTSSISGDLKKTFGLKAARHEAAQKLNNEEWKHYEQIKKLIDGVRQYEERQYKLEYKTRVETVAKRLINEAGSKTRAFKPPWARHDKFDKSAIILQARRVVHDQHDKVMSFLDRQETQKIDELVQRSEHNVQKREKPKLDFQKAVDRRSGLERRVHTRSRS